MSRPYHVPRWLLFVLLFGTYLTVRGYHSRDGDQAYRLPLLLHLQDSRVFADDPFVGAFETFNPHKGYLALLNFASKPLGLSFALFALFTLTFALTCLGIDRLTRAVWPEGGKAIGGIAVVLVLLAKAGNIGTNHLFEAMLLDRGIGFALGWVALALATEGKIWLPSFLIGLATFIHPSVGLQLGALLFASWLVWAVFQKQTGQRWRSAGLGCVALTLAILPATLGMLGQSAKLFDGLSLKEFRLIGVELQMAQHMVPSLWRTPQWMAWGSYILLASLSLLGTFTQVAPKSPVADDPQPASDHARHRFVILLGLLLIGLSVAYVAIEWIGNIRVTVFQPFRMATIARGLALITLARRCQLLWGRGDQLGKLRVLLLSAGLAGDWAFVVAAAVELIATCVESRHEIGRRPGMVLIALTLFLGMMFLYRHDTERGQWLFLAAMIGLAALGLVQSRVAAGWTRKRLIFAGAVSWLIPLAAFIVPFCLPGSSQLANSLASRCRFSAIAVDDVERLAVWCRTQTDPDSRFITPPGPKTFRLWALRSVAFNRAASPYHAKGLKDWVKRFREHVGFEGSSEKFVEAYLADRHGIENRYFQLNPAQLATLAESQGANHVLALASLQDSNDGTGPLQRLRSEGRYAIYRVNPKALAHRGLNGWPQSLEASR